MESDTYITIKAFSQGIYKEKGSRFISIAYPVSTLEEIKKYLKNKKGTSLSQASLLRMYVRSGRETFRMSDDGEPSGTAGRPIMGQINSCELTNILIVL